jgi:hypothetical protein
VDILFAIRLSSDFLQGSNIYKLWENYTDICWIHITVQPVNNLHKCKQKQCQIHITVQPVNNLHQCKQKQCQICKKYCVSKLLIVILHESKW